MNKQVTVTQNENGQVVNECSNPDYGYIRVSQERSIFENGFFRPQKVSALIMGKIEHLKSAGFYNGQTIPGKIVVFESMTPKNTKNPEKELKQGGKTGINCTVDGKNIYRRTEFTDDVTTVDITIKHDNGAEIAIAANVVEDGKGEFKM